MHEQKDGRFFIGATPLVGRLSGTTLVQLADTLEAARLLPAAHHPAPEARGPGRCAGPRWNRWWRSWTRWACPPAPSLFRRGTIACTGIEFCKLAIVEHEGHRGRGHRRTGDAGWPTSSASGQLPGLIALNINGCPNSCARIQTADIGLKGMMLPTPDGDPTPGFQVHLGGGLASVDREEAGLGRTIRGLKVSVEGLPDYVERVVRQYIAHRRDGETFAEWAHRGRRGDPAMTRAPAWTTEDLRAARRAPGAAELGLGSHGPGVIGWVARNFGCGMSPSPARWPTPCSRRLVADQLPGVDVLFLETGYHFPETYATREEVAANLRVNVVDVLPANTVEQQDRCWARTSLPATPASAARCARWPRCGAPWPATALVHRSPPRRGAHPDQHAAGQLG